MKIVETLHNMKAAYELCEIWKNLPNELKTIDIYIIYEAQTLP